ncbi:hypothetical protein [Caloramator sp. Dgby_cultured_2]|uniref:hypothetical protein n=1 Tax=Caloramator sp. Dgby_cultured_2 TaxID=3029174 RepID=UPI00237D7E37|nr:hypothetical protein [Caloramator sp. Dgby_cultured_2]WDU83247.1 hypothetical protein PWK10_00320 [Caloramator sp. Dgby_cultured_2]
MLFLPSFVKATEGEVIQSTPVELQSGEIVDKQIDNTNLNEKTPFLETRMETKYLMTLMIWLN